VFQEGIGHDFSDGLNAPFVSSLALHSNLGRSLKNGKNLTEMKKGGIAAALISAAFRRA
jgi:hypothetical protein